MPLRIPRRRKRTDCLLPGLGNRQILLMPAADTRLRRERPSVIHGGGVLHISSTFSSTDRAYDLVLHFHGDVKIVLEGSCDGFDWIDPPCPEDGGNSAGSSAAAWVSNVGIGLGVVGLGLGAYLMLSESKQPSAGQAARSAPWVLTPILSQHGGRIAARAVW